MKHPVANPWRGEVDIKLDGAPYAMRPTFAALSRIEQALGMGLVALARRLSESALGAHELSVIIAVCINAAANAELFSFESVQELLAKTGLADAMCAVAHLLATIFEGVKNA